MQPIITASSHPNPLRETRTSLHMSTWNALFRPVRNRVASTVAAALVLSSSFALSGCNKAEQVAVAPPKPKAPMRISDADIAKYKPDESGAIMVIMYHRVSASEPDHDLNRRPETFRKDLETLRAKGYYPVNAVDLVENKMDVPLGKTPIVLSFDDALPTQLRLVTGRDGQPHIDPNCAVGIMETFHKAHPDDWPLRATFFVLPKEGHGAEPFGQAQSVDDKFAYLTKSGYEIANHTSTHSNMRRMTAAKVRWELGTALGDIKSLAPDAQMKTFALPYGKLPRAKDAQQALLAGTEGKNSYKHEAVFLAAWRPVLSPNTRADKKLAQGGTFCLFDAMRLERIKPDPREAKLPGTLEYWLKYFDANKTQRYISDGNRKIVSVPASRQSAVDTARVKSQGQTLQVYGAGGASGKNGKSGGSLSVE